MFKHIVVWKLKPAAEGAGREENARRVKAALEGLRGKIPGMRHLEAGVSFNRSAAAYDVALYAEFESRAALEAYATHPEHLRAVEFISRVRDERIVVDYEAD